MTIFQNCIDTLVTIAAIDDKAVVPLGFSALASYEAACPDIPEIQVKRFRLLALEFAQRSKPTYTAFLFELEISRRARAAAEIAHG